MEVGWKNICLKNGMVSCVLTAWQGAKWLLVVGGEMLAAHI